MKAVYTLKAKVSEDVKLELIFASKKVALDIREQLKEADIDATVAMTKVLD